LISVLIVSLNIKHFKDAPHHALGMIKLKINRCWGLTEARVWARLLIGRNHIPLLVFGDDTELGTKAHQRQFQYIRFMRNGHGN
jgi:L-alanine-DL-glutamate epimerase-like enolase superfamily enzyme